LGFICTQATWVRFNILPSCGTLKLIIDTRKTDRKKFMVSTNSLSQIPRTSQLRWYFFETGGTCTFPSFKFSALFSPGFPSTAVSPTAAGFFAALATMDDLLPLQLGQGLTMDA